MNIIVPVSCDFDYEEGKVIPGRETKIACDGATKMMDNRSYILLTATRDGKKWDRVRMMDVMKVYLLSQGIHPRRIKEKQATTFNTFGEMQAVARYVSQNVLFGVASPGVPRGCIILVVKWWHAPRCRLLLRYHLFRERGRRLVPDKIKVVVVNCESHASKGAIAKEFFLAWPKNLLRVAIDSFRRV